MTSHAVLTAEKHRDLRIRTDRGPELGDAVMSALVVPDEFRQVQNEYVILFRLSPERDAFTAVALLGFEAGENLYLTADGWDARHRPLSLDIQPFLIGRIEGSADKQVHIDMASPRLASGPGDDQAVRLFDGDGRPTPYLETVSERLGTLDAGYEAAPGFFAALRRHELLEPVTLEITLDDGSVNRLVGYHLIDEARLQRLDAEALGALSAGDHLLPIFMALASLANLPALIARKNRRVAGG